MSKYAFGIDIGGTTVKIGLFTEMGEIFEKWEIHTRKEELGKYILDDVAKSIEDKLLLRSIEKTNVMGIGIGVPGPVLSDGTVVICENIGWGCFNVATKMNELTGITNVKVANDANEAALGEFYKGGGKEFSSMIMITLGTGVGGGLIEDARIVSGFGGAAGEIGHMTIEQEEKEPCVCGKFGCLEQYVSAIGVVRLAKRALVNSVGMSSVLKEIDEEKLTAKEVFDAANVNDELALGIVNQFGHYLGLACSNIATVFDPQGFVIGGGVSKAGTIILDVVNKYYDLYSVCFLKPKAFRLAQLGNDAGIYGGVGMVLMK